MKGEVEVEEENCQKQEKEPGGKTEFSHCLEKKNEGK